LDIGEHIILDQERCVLCTRCIRSWMRFRKHRAGIVNRGHESTISIFPGRRLDNAYSGNVTDICPVGAPHLEGVPIQAKGLVPQKSRVHCPWLRAGLQHYGGIQQWKIFRFMPRDNSELKQKLDLR